MGGKRNDFTELPVLNGSEPIQPVLTMSWQHHARFVPGTDETQITLFDNHGKVTNHGDCNALCSRGLHIAINNTISPPTVKFLREFRHPAQLQAQSQGSMQPLSPSVDDLGNVFIGWGRCPSFTEHNSIGEPVMNVQFSPWHSDDIPDALDNYRAYKMDWSATPWWDPAIAPRRDKNGDIVVYVSWNGATEVAHWVVRGSQESEWEDGNEVLAEAPRSGFETKLIIGETECQYIWAEALDKEGNILRTTEIVDVEATDLSIAYDTYEANAKFPFGKGEEEEPEDTRPQAQSSNTSLIMLLTALITLVVVTLSIGTIWLWQRYRNYNQLKPEDFDLSLEELLDEDKQNGSGDGEYGNDNRHSGVHSESRFRDDERPLLQKEESNTHKIQSGTG